MSLSLDLSVVLDSGNFSDFSEITTATDAAGDLNESDCTLDMIFVVVGTKLITRN